MNPEHWEDVKQIVDTCLDLDPRARDAHLAALCAADPALRAEVESLLAAYDEADDFMDTPALESNPQAPIAGERIGNYELRELIGEGGMGAVYRAVRSSDFQKQVAIKLVKRGMDTESILRRFRHERQILARLEHPLIARLLDGGATADGRPYLVMEYIDGTPITDYCDENKLSVPERLELFRTVCSAVQFAHQNLIVHRDLKPSNILVTADGTPKLLDFGIAKLLDPEPDATLTSVRMMTPECASPEQVRGEPVTTASDIYALGVLLYQVLTGERPYRITTRTQEEISRVVCGTEPARPSAVRRSLSADLDNIVLKAMHKEAARRYVSVEQLSEDLRRSLAGLPVMARKDTFSYRASKFLQRHKTASIAALLLLLSLIGGLAATLWQARIANAQRARAERRFQDVRKLAHALIFNVHDAIQNLPGSTPARKQIVQEALVYLDSLAQESAGDRSLQRELAAAYDRIGDVQGGFRSVSLGDAAGALKSYRKALAIRQVLAAADPKDRDVLRELARDHGKVSDQLMATGDLAGVGEQCRELIRIAGALVALDPANRGDRAFRAVVSGDCGFKLSDTGDWQQGIESCRQSVAELEELMAADPSDNRLRRILAITYNRLGQMIESHTGRHEEALSMQEKSVANVESLLSKDAANTDLRRIRAWAEIDCGRILSEGEPARALQYYRKALAELESLAAADRQNVQFRSDVAFGLLGSGAAEMRLGNLNGARQHLQQALAILEAVPASNARNRDTELAMALVLSALGDVYSRMGNGYRQTAIGWYDRSLPLLQAARQHRSLGGSEAGLPDRVSEQLKHLRE